MSTRKRSTRAHLWLVAVLASACGTAMTSSDAGTADAGTPDAGAADAGAADAGAADAGAADAGTSDAGAPDAGTPDAGVACVPACPAPTFCNTFAGRCVDVDFTCAASGAPFTEFRPRALGIATNELSDGRYDAGGRFELLARTGLRFVQLGVGIEQVAVDGGARSWARFDSLFGAAHAANLEPVVLFSAGAVPTDEVAWRAFVREAVLRYGSAGLGWVSDWQLWNEPTNSMDPFVNRVDDYIALLDATFDEVHAADPQGRVWAPAVVFHAANDNFGDGGTWPESLAASATMVWLDRVLELGRFDVVSIHLYEPSLARMLAVQLAVVDRMAAHNRRAVPLVVNEGHMGLLEPSRTPPGTCPYSAASETTHALDVGAFYGCLLGANASQVLWFNSSDRYTPGDGGTCGGDNVRRTGVLGFELPPSTSFEPATPKDSYYVLEKLAAVIRAQATARARLEALPSPCRLGADGGCPTTLMWTRRERAVGALQVRSGGALVACTTPSQDLGTVAVTVGGSRSRFELHEAADCAAVAGPLLDTVFVRGEAATPNTRAAVFALDNPCHHDGGGSACAVALGVWSEGIDAGWPYLRLYAGANAYRPCLPSNQTHLLRSGLFQADAGILYRLYEVDSCDAGASQGRLLSATRAFGVAAQ